MTFLNYPFPMKLGLSQEMSMQDALKDIQNLDGVKTVPIYHQNLPGGYDEIPHYVGVLNTGTGQIAMTASDRYIPISHEQGLSKVVDAIDHLGEKTLVKVESLDKGNTAGLYVLFPNLMINDRADGVMAGVRFRNFYGEKYTFRGNAFMWRLRCRNGMTFADIIKGFQVKTFHNNPSIDSLTDDIQDFINGILQASHRVGEVIEAAQSSPIAFKDFAEIKHSIKPLLGTDKAAEAVAATVPENTNRWDLYNAITSYASHDTKVRLTTRDELVRKAERILTVDQFVPVPLPA